MIRSAMLMAAGLGTRLRPFTDFCPKPLLPLMGVPIAQFALDSLAEAGVGRVVVNVHSHPELARKGYASLDKGDTLELKLSDESGKLLGSAGGVRKALPELGEGPFFLINGDLLCDFDLGGLAQAHEKLRRRWGVRMTMAVHPRGPSGGEYREIHVECAPGENIGRVSKIGAFARGRPFFASLAVVEPEAFLSLPFGEPSDMLERVLLPEAQAGRMGAWISDGFLHDVGSPALWLASHLRVLESLETGRLNPRWRKRIESINSRLAQSAWVSKRSPRVIRSAGWAGPCYWSPEGDRIAEAPANFGPGAVVYGSASDYGSGALQGSGIGYRGKWVSL